MQGATYGHRNRRQCSRVDREQRGAVRRGQQSTGLALPSSSIISYGLRMRARVLQVIAALITIAIMFALREWLTWFFHQFTGQFALGFLVGAFIVLLIWLYEEKSSARRSGATQQQGSRHLIDL